MTHSVWFGLAGGAALLLTACSDEVTFNGQTIRGGDAAEGAEQAAAPVQESDDQVFVNGRRVYVREGENSLTAVFRTLAGGGDDVPPPEQVALAAEEAPEAGPRVIDVPTGYAAVGEVADISLDPTANGAILRATAGSGAAGLHSATLLPVGSDEGSLRYLMIARPGGLAASGAAPTASLYIRRGDLSGVSSLRVEGSGGGQTIRVR